MTTPQQPGRTSGQSREEQAKKAAHIIAGIYAAAEAKIYKTLAGLAVKVLKGALLETLARRRLRHIVAAVLASAETRAGKVLAAADQSARADVERIMREDRGWDRTPAAPGSSNAGQQAGPLLPPGPPPRAPRGAGEAGDAARAVQEALGLTERPGPDSIAVKLHEAGLTALRTTDDVFRDVIAEAMSYHTAIGAKVRDLRGPERAAESLSRLQVAQKALNLFAERGITAFTDSAGRQWELASYVEMATRAAASRMHLMLQLAAMGPAGTDLVIIDGPSAAMSCPKCAPYEGAVLSLGATTPGTPVSVTSAAGLPVGAVVKGTLAQAVAAGLFHPNCFPAEVVASAPFGVRAADARWYEGDLVVIHTAGGDGLPVTPNHPVLTPEGWVAAGDLQVGQHVVRYSGGNERVDAAVPAMGPHDQLVPSRIGDVFDAIAQSGTTTAVRMPGSPEQFHGDGSSADVHVVLAHGLLHDHGNAKGIGDRALIGSHAELAFFSGLGSRDEPLLAAAAAADGIMGGGGERGTLCWRHAGEAAAHGFAAADLTVGLDDVLAEGGLGEPEAGGNLPLGLSALIAADGLGDLVIGQATMRAHASGLELTVDGASADAKGLGDLGEASPGTVALDQVVSLGRRQVAAHVYNLQTEGGWYAANGIIVHNCRHSAVPFTDGAGVLPVAGAQRGFVNNGHPWWRGVFPDAESPAYKAEQKQRAMERLIRKWDARRQLAVTPQAIARARAGHAAAVAALEAHIKAYHQPRRPGRERAGAAR